jgi:transcriptional regulator of NAD metabolism
MNSSERRNKIEEMLMNSKESLKGQDLSKKFGVTRQVIVKDIAILRASGSPIIATPDGYIITKAVNSNVRRVLALNHRTDEISDELESIVKFGGTIEDVIVEHPLYGEIKGMLMIKTPFDIEKFIKRLNEYKAEPLLILTGGVHLHTVITENEESMKNIIEELKQKRYLISD